MASLATSQANAELLRIFYRLFETYLQKNNASLPILKAGDNSGNVPESFEKMIETVSSRYQVDPALVKAVVQSESNFDASAVSAAGAQGLMQLMPETAQDLGVEDALDPMQNLEGGVRYLKQMLNQYDGNVSLALAAYNAGPGAVAQYEGIPPYEETQTYVNRVLEQYRSKMTAGGY